MAEITIPIDEYKELISTKTRVDVVVERIMHDKFTSMEDILWILDTELSTTMAQDIRDKMEEERKKFDNNFFGKCEGE